MEPRIHVITVAVDHLERALSFYRDGLGLQSEGIIATEFGGDEENAAGAIAMFHLHGGLILSLYPRAELAKDARVSLDRPTSGGSASVTPYPQGRRSTRCSQPPRRPVPR